MAAPLRVGIAGLGTVGASVVRLIAEQREALSQRAGRPIEVVAVSPGTGFGERGEGFVRIALVENEQRIRQAARNIRRFLESAPEKLHNVVPLATRR